MMKIHLCFLGLTITACMFLAGCKEGKPKELADLTPCTLTFQYEDGTPVDQATIKLFPEDTNNAWSMGGITDDSGKLIVKTDRKYDGAMPGKYKVTCSKLLLTPTGKKGEEGEDICTSTPLVDAEFTKSPTTPLAIEVVSKTPLESTLTVKKAK